METKTMTRVEAAEVARAARTLTKQQRWAEEMRRDGWIIPAQDKDKARP
jgi:hypothetical protein